MEFKSKRVLWVSIGGLVMVSTLALVGWRMSIWNRTGWTGMVYIFDAKQSSVRQTFWGFKPGSVMAIHPASPAEQAGIQRGDQVVKIDGIPTHDLQQLQKHMNMLRVGDVVRFTIQRDREQRDLLLPIRSPLHSREVPIALSSSLVVGLMFFGIGLLVYWKKFDDRRAFVFYLMSTVTAAYFLMQPMAQLDASSTRGLMPSGALSRSEMMVTFLFAFFALVVVPLLFHLTLIFPRRRPILQAFPKILWWVYGIPIAAVIGVVLGTMALALLPASRAPIAATIVLPLLGIGALIRFSGLRRWRSERWGKLLLSEPVPGMLLWIGVEFLLVGAAGLGLRVSHSSWLKASLGLIVPGLSGILLGIYYIAFLPVATCIALARSYRESGPEEKRQVKWPLWGTLTAVAGHLVISLAVLIFTLVVLLPSGRVTSYTVNVPVGIIQKLLYLLIPISFAFAILKHRLMEIDLLIKRTVSYSLLTGFIVVLYFSLTGGVGLLLLKFAPIRGEWMTVASTLIVAAVFVPARSRMQRFVDRRFFRTRYDYSQALRNVSRETSESTELAPLLRSLAEHLQQALQNRAVVIFSRATGEHIFWATAKIGVPDDVLGRLRFEGQSRVLSFMEEPFLVRDKELPPEELRRLREVKSEYIVPVRLKGDLLAFLSLSGKLSDAAYDREDREFLIAVAEQMAVGVYNLHLRKQTQEFAEAREIQQALLPKETPQLSGCEISSAWQPSRMVGGDYFDVLKFSDTRAALCIADVSGKGMPAALLMSNLQAAVKAFSGESVEPKELCGRVNRMICSHIAQGKFITFFYVCVDSEKKTLTYVNAGHSSPLLFRGDGSIERMEKGGAVLGVFKDWSYEQGALTLLPGDRMVLFTDGITEATCDGEQEFGETGVVEAIRPNIQMSASALQQKLMHTVTEFCLGEFQDDATLLVLAVHA
ncbi:MAG: SpoIIE family protein phosphatase [Acidobacteriia bacterium]|nr:SpoIIE family protein phosphatase [Terriglobia bacterium]